MILLYTCLNQNQMPYFVKPVHIEISPIMVFQQMITLIGQLADWQVIRLICPLERLKHFNVIQGAPY